MFRADCDNYRSGGAKPFMMTIKSFLLERNKEDDHDSSFTKTLFKVRCTSDLLQNNMALTVALVSILVNWPHKRNSRGAWL